MDILLKIVTLRDKRCEMDKVADVLSKIGIDFKVNYGRGFIEVFPCWKIWFISYDEYYRWNKGRTYYNAPDDKFYHSGIPMSDDEVKLNMAKPFNVKKIASFLGQ